MLAFTQFSNSFATETGTESDGLRDQSIYGRFGDNVDATTKTWERCVIFGGEIALTLTVLCLEDRTGDPIFLRNFDMPHILDNYDVVTICEVQRVSKSVFDRHLTQYGCPFFPLSYDEIVE